MTTFKIENHQIVDGRIPDYILRSIPAGTTILNLSGCESLTTLPELPAGLNKLDLSWCTSLTTLPELPAGLKELDLYGCISLANLPELPQGLKKLTLSGYESLTSLPELPAGLNKLYLSWCTSLTTLPELPAGLKELDLFVCRSLTTLPELPRGLNELNLSGCESLTTLPELPAGLNELNLSWCTSLTTLPELPAGLNELNLSWCTSLTTLPELPAGLNKLYLSWCTSLTTLPELPASIEYLNLSGCTSLLPESIPKLLALEEANHNNPNFQLYWPAHLVSNNQAITSLKESYRAYYANDPNFARIEPSADHPTNFQTLKLFQRFTSENLADRGKEQVIAQAILVAEEIKKNPEILEILDKVSENYLTACVNQPVSGFLEIASLMAIAKADNITAKIAKAKILRAQQLIKNNISSLRNLSNQTVGAGVEVELGNAMIREVHKKLLAKKVIKEPWLGIPGNISYEGSIRSFLTEENINKMTDLAQKALLAENSEQETIEFLCAAKPEFWTKMIFSKEEREDFDQKHNDRIKQLREQIIELDPSNADELNKITQLQQQIKEIEEEKSTQFDKKLKQRTQNLLDKPEKLIIKLTSPQPFEPDSSTTQNYFYSQSSDQGRSPRDRRHEDGGGVFPIRRSNRSDFDYSVDQGYNSNDSTTSPRLNQHTASRQSLRDYSPDLRAIHESSQGSNIGDQLSQDSSNITSLGIEASVETEQDILTSDTSPRAIESNPSLTSGQTLLRRGLFERLATRNQDQLQESAQLVFPNQGLSEPAFDQRHQGSSQGFGLNSLPQTGTERESGQLFTTTETPQNQENRVSADLVFLNQAPAINSNSHQQHSPRTQTENADSSALGGQTTSTRTLSKT